jgi:hypothetical protein
LCFLMILAAILGYVALYFYNKKKIKTNWFYIKKLI